MSYVGASIKISVSSSLTVDCIIPFPSPRVLHTSYENELDEDGDVICEMLATNLNDAHELRVDQNTLVGRTDEGYGAAQRIKPVLPLYMENKELKLSATIQESIYALESSVSVLQGQVSALQGQMSAISIATLNLLLAQSPVARFNTRVVMKVNATVV